MELSSKVNLCTARERPWLPLRRELDCCIKDLSNKTEGEITRGGALRRGSRSVAAVRPVCQGLPPHATP